MSKKGFTLVELLAVIVILSVVMLIGSVSISAIRLKMNESMFETKLEFVVSAAKSYGQNNKDEFRKLDDRGNYISTELTPTVNDLIISKDLETDATFRGGECLDGYPSAGVDTSDGGSVPLCYVVVDDSTGRAINALVLRVYMQYNRIYACIPPTSDNLNILGETVTTEGGVITYEKYGNLNYYCES